MKTRHLTSVIIVALLALLTGCATADGLVRGAQRVDEQTRDRYGEDYLKKAAGALGR